MAWFRTGTGESLDADLATQKIDIESLAGYIADIMQAANGIYTWGKYTAQNGDLLDYVHDENQNTYPDGGTKNGFWYKRAHSAFTNIEVTTMPTKTTYNVGENFNTSGMVVSAIYEAGLKEAVTGFTCSPQTLNAAGNQTVTISYTKNGTTKTTTITVKVYNYATITWSGGTDEEVCAMVAAADAGTINLSDYWTVGDERAVQLHEMGSTGVGEAHVAQEVTMVLLHRGGKTLTNGEECNFIVGIKNNLKEAGAIEPIIDRARNWEDSERRIWCNQEFRNAIPHTLRPIFKQHVNKTVSLCNSDTLIESKDWFALAAEKEIFGKNTYSRPAEANALTQFAYYQTEANRIKKMGDTGSAQNWWTRSPKTNYANTFCAVSSAGAAITNTLSNKYGLSPFGCI